MQLPLSSALIPLPLCVLRKSAPTGFTYIQTSTPLPPAAHLPPKVSYCSHPLLLPGRQPAYKSSPSFPSATAAPPPVTSSPSPLRAPPAPPRPRPLLFSRFSPATAAKRLCSSTSFAMTTDPPPIHGKATVVASKLEKPDLDDRSYRVIQLPNKLEALLVHDPDTDKASAALDVHVGNFSDSIDLQVSFGLRSTRNATCSHPHARFRLNRAPARHHPIRPSTLSAASDTRFRAAGWKQACGHA